MQDLYNCLFPACPTLPPNWRKNLMSDVVHGYNNFFPIDHKEIVSVIIDDNEYLSSYPIYFIVIIDMIFVH